METVFYWYLRLRCYHAFFILHSSLSVRLREVEAPFGVCVTPFTRRTTQQGAKSPVCDQTTKLYSSVVTNQLPKERQTVPPA